MNEEKSKQKYIWFSFDGIGYCIVKKLIDEGHEVIVAEVQDIKELGEGEDEDAEKRRRRLSLYDGILEKHPASKIIKNMEKIENKDDYIVIFDFNCLWKYSEMAIKMGYTKGLFPTKELYDLEKDRESAKDFVKNNYSKLKVAETHEFKDIKSGIDFLSDTEDRWVLKGNWDECKTVVPETDDIEQSKIEITDALENEKKKYEKEGYILERYISKGIEFTPEMWWMDGEPVASTVDIENKPMGSRNESIQLGCAQNLVIATNLEDQINKIAFPRAIHEKAKQHKGLFIWDAGIMYDHVKKELYFTEFCAQRMGWDAIMTELEMAGSANDFFTSLISGQNPFTYQFGSAVRGLNLHKDGKERRVLEGLPITVKEEYKDHTWLYEVKMEEDREVSTGSNWDLVVFTGAGDTPNESVEKAYEARYAFGFENLYARPQEDFISMQYHSSIPLRYTFINHKYIEGADFKEISAFSDDIQKTYDDKLELVYKDLQEELNNAKTFLEEEYVGKFKSQEEEKLKMKDDHKKEMDSLKQEMFNIMNS